MREANTVATPSLSPWRAHYRLCKPRVVGLITFTAVVGMFLAGLSSW